MKILLPVVALALFFTSGCGTITFQSDAYDRSDRLAIVSLNVAGISSGETGSATPAYITTMTNALLSHSEHLLKKKYRVVKIASLADKYQTLSFGEPLAGVYSPTIGAHAMTNFEKNRVASLSPKTVDQLTEALGVDAVAVIYTKWTTQLKRSNDGIITNEGPGVQVMLLKHRPVVTTSLRIYRRGGDQVFEGREQAVAVAYADSADAAKAIRERAKARTACTEAYVEAMTELVKHIK